MTGIEQGGDAVLAINSGSSSLKFGLYERDSGAERSLFYGTAASIGKPDSKLSIRDAQGRALIEESRPLPSQTAALQYGVERLLALSKIEPAAIGHRIVHGGPHLLHHEKITPAVVETLERAVHFAPLHIPSALALIRGMGGLYPHIPQFACFDTAFHCTMPESASRFALPRYLWDQGVRRYGFHGLSYESIVRILGSDLAPRTVIAHLGNGSSLAALRDGISVDTSMGLTPTGGIPMSTRSGDLDPGVLLYLMRTTELDGERLEAVINRESGLAGISGGQSDMRALEAGAERGDPGCAMAIEIFVRSIAKTIAAFAAVLGGLDLLVFTGGIGENSRTIRARSCEPLGFLGIRLDPERNARGDDLISAGDSCRVRVIATDEDGEIAHHTWRLFSAG